MRNPNGTYKNEASDAQLSIIENLEIESENTIATAESMIAAAKKRTRLTHTGPAKISFFRTLLAKTHFNPNTWITEVTACKRDLDNLIELESQLDARRNEKIYS